MNLAEFKAWFDGYTEDMKDAPSKKQWERIKARVAEIDGKPITQTIYLDRYVRPYWHDYYGGILNTNVGYNAQTKGAAGLSVASSLVGQNAAELSKAASAQFDSRNAAELSKAASAQFDSRNAMYAAGKAEAQAA